MELLDRRYPGHGIAADHSLAFYGIEKGVDPANYVILARRLTGTAGSIANIDPDGFDAERQLSTQNAMGSGVALLFNAFLLELPLHGRVDFLARVPDSSRLGNFHYVPAMLADTVFDEGQLPLELCCFADMLESIQGRRPGHFLWVCNGASDTPAVRRLPVSQWMFEYRAVKIRYRRMLEEFDPRRMPDPAESSSWGRWSGYARQLLDAASARA